MNMKSGSKDEGGGRWRRLNRKMVPGEKFKSDKARIKRSQIK
jgi:hypothetical protein